MTALQAELPQSPYFNDGQQAYIAASPSDLRNLFSQVEIEFHDSKAYQKILSWFQHQLPDNKKLVSQLTRALGKEAIRLTLRQLVANSSPPTMQGLPVPQSVSPVSAETPSRDSDQNPVKSPPVLVHNDSYSNDGYTSALGEADVVEQRDIAQWDGDSELSNPFDSTDVLEVNQDDASPREASYAGVRDGHTAGKAIDRGSRGTGVNGIDTGRQEFQQTPSTLVEVGQRLKEVRQQRSLTLDQIHHITHVPKHHIQALETGALDRLPEDVYVRGFVRHLSNALGLDSKILTCYPSPANTKTAARYRPIPPSVASKTSPVYLRPVHLYTGYATLMLGALGSLCWVTWQPLMDSVGMPQSDASAATDADATTLAAHGENLTTKLRYFELSKQQARRMDAIDAIAVPELILEQLQVIQSVDTR